MARASAPKEQERVAEAAKRSVETCSAVQRRTRGSASSGAGGAAWPYHFYGAYQRFNFKHRASTRR
jgi:hypothetical protein